jgi:translation initiation factor eIF-2B subunit delta
MSQHQQLAEKIVSTIQHDLHSGATELSRDALVYLSRYADSMHAVPVNQCKISLRSLGEDLRCLRPSMAPLQNILGEWQVRLEGIQSNTTTNLIADVQALCVQLIDDINARQNKLVGHAINCLSQASIIMTISRSSTVFEVFKNLTQRPLGFIICESRPACEGKTLAAALASSDVSVEYIVDAAMGNHIQQAGAVVVGADTILGDGSVVNKCGTSLLALAARYYNRPLYVVADSSKCVGFCTDKLTQEEMPFTELAAPESPWVYPHNFYFDVTDAVLVDTYITEFGWQSTWPWPKSNHFK